MIRRALWRLATPTRSLLTRHERIGVAVERVFDRVPALHDAISDVARGDPVERYQRWIREYDAIDEADLTAMRKEQACFAESTLFSLVIPLAGTGEVKPEALERSLRDQIHEHWEVRYANAPPDEPGLVAEAWNRSLRSAAGEFAVLIDPRSVLRPHALFLFARVVERHPDAVVIYADEDVIDDSGIRSNHYFKPDWNEALLCSQNYFGGFVAFRRALALAVGGCREELDGDCAWGLFLRMTVGAPPGSIHHLPFVLSHRRAGCGAAHQDPSDDAERERAARAHEKRLALVGRHARVEPVGESSYRTRYALPRRPPTVSVIIPSTGKLGLLRPCLEGLLNRTTYPDLEVLLAVNEIQKEFAERRDYLDDVAARPQVRVLYHEDRAFNFSWVNNWAVAQARGKLVCFLNDDTEVIGPDWLSAMVAHVVQDRVAAVGAMLYSSKERIQHAGVVLGVGRLAGHSFKRRPRGIRGYHDRAVVDQDVSCVTAACMLVQRDVFLSVGGFDEALAIAFNDIDLCLRLREAAWRILWTPSAELYHRESVSVGRHEVGDHGDRWVCDWELIHSRWGAELVSDPHYNPNLSLDALQLWEPAFPPRVSSPWRASSREEVRSTADGPTR
jgi:GT2 family glycosyltransferase